MQIKSLDIPDVKILTPKKHGDHRGFFSEVYSRKTLADLGVDIEFVQDNHSLSARKGTLRGLHFQTQPFAQAKLVRVLRGSILDVAVDLRSGSSTFGKHVSAVLSPENWDQILVPIGFAHGFVTLEPGTEISYKVSNYYSPENDCGLLWSDPALSIDWQVSAADVVLSAKDAIQPKLSEIGVPFL